MNTYCGKNCENCTFKEKLSCTGCESSNHGNNGAVACVIAKCCRDKGHDVCSTCNHASDCVTLRDRGNIPSYRIREIAADEERKERNLKKAPFLGKWIGILFWLFVPGIIAGIMTMESVATKLPLIYTAGEVLNVVVTVIYGLILLKISGENRHYYTSGICCMIVAVVGVLTAYISGSESTRALTLLLTVPATIVTVLGEFHEYTGHKEVLQEISYEMAEKWRGLWKWYICIYIGMVISVFLIILLPILGAIVMLAVAIGVVVVDIIKLVYLNQTTKVFQQYKG